MGMALMDAKIVFRVLRSVVEREAPGRTSCGARVSRMKRLWARRLAFIVVEGLMGGRTRRRGRGGGRRDILGRLAWGASSLCGRVGEGDTLGERLSSSDVSLGEMRLERQKG